MVTLYHCTGARSFRTIWIFEEIGAPYTLKVLTYPPREDSDFVAQNPTATVPFLRDGDVALSESSAIAIYLSQKHANANLASFPGDPDYADWLNWTIFAETAVTNAISNLLHYGGTYPHDPIMGEPQRIDLVVDYYEYRLREAVALIKNRLESRQWIVGDRFTAADIAMGYNFYLAGLIGQIHHFDSLSDYVERITSRPAYHRAVATDFPPA